MAFFPGIITFWEIFWFTCPFSYQFILPAPAGVDLPNAFFMNMVSHYTSPLRRNILDGKGIVTIFSNSQK